MSNYRYPSVFISHGTPMLAFGEDANQQMLQNFADSMPKPKAIIFVSAHSPSSENLHILNTNKNKIIHDFAGFPAELYDINYECGGSPELAQKVSDLLTKAGFKTQFDVQAPLDHGIWIPLKHLYPKGDVPVTRVTLPLALTPAQILKMGHALATLREEGIMIVASGSAVHNLSEIKWSHKMLGGAEWAKEFEAWIITTIARKDVDAIVNAEEHPLFLKCHPTPEHYLPIIFSIGATLPGDNLTILNQGIEYYSISMLTYTLNHAQVRSLH